MKKGLMLLTTLLVAGVAATPLVHQAKSTNQTFVAPQEILRSHDFVDLTMNKSVTSVKVDLPVLSYLLDEQLGNYQLKSTVMALTNKDNAKLEWVNDNSNSFMLALILGTAQSIDNMTLSVSKDEPALNYLSAYYHNVEGREVVTTIGMFDWSNHDMSSYWTKDVMFDFELHY